jgi:hypothetical protein
MLFCTSLVYAQKDASFNLVRSVSGQISDFTIDNLGNFYIINQEGRLKKLNPNGDSVAVFNDVRRYGKLYSIDVTNPLKVLLYYKNFGTIVVLDRFLNVRTTIDLRRENLLQVKAIGQAYDNNIWVFDEQESKLKKIADDGKLLDQSADFRMIFDSMPSPQFIVDQNKFIYLCDSLKGVYLFDYFGAFKNRIALYGWTDFTVINGVLFGRDKNSLYRYEPGTLNLAQFAIPAYMLDAKKIKIGSGNLYVLREDGLAVYSYTP